MAPALLDDVELPENPPAAGDYLLLGEIDFTHPLFAPFANPRYSDFTKIHFWKHEPLTLKESATTRAIARFDNGQPALLERKVAGTLRMPLSDGTRSVPATEGRVLILASGWQPEQSQLALSSKFVPLVGALLDQACGATQGLAGVTVNHPWRWNGVQRTDATPGIHHLGQGADEVRYAVNLDPIESNTAPLELEQLEQLGVRTSPHLSRAQELARQRQQRDTELESRQKIWRWLVVAALGILIAETWWAGVAAGRIQKSMEAVA
jgi:hypothetical protein